MKFAHITWLILGAIIIPFIWWIMRYFEQKRTLDLKRFASEHLLSKLTNSISQRQRMFKRWLFLSGLLLCFAALSRPQLGFRWEEAKRKGIDVLFAVDTSRSMLAQDVDPDRLTRAKMAVLDLLAKLDGDRVGLIAFAGSAFLQSPLTLDYDAFRQSVEATDTRVIPKGGTDLASAIQEADKAFSLGNQNHKFLILITDGEDLEANGIAVARQAAEHGLKIFTVGVGSSTGEIIPLHSEAGGTDFLKDEQGQVVKSRLDESTLRQIAEATGGFYEPLGQQGQGLENIYQKALAPLPKKELSSRMAQIPIDRFQWPLSFGILCFIAEMLLGDRKVSSKFRIQNSGFKVSCWIFLFIYLLHPSFSYASPQSAERAYRKGNFGHATSAYRAAIEKKPNKAELQFNLGAAAYKIHQYGEAASAFQKALQSDQVDLQQQAFYNLGNSQYRLGQTTEKNDPQQTIQQWQQALTSFQNALQIKPQDPDAKFNYDYVKKKLDELQKQQPQDKKNDKEDKKDDKKEENKDDPKKDDQNSKNQNEDSKSDQNKNQDDSKDSPQSKPNKPKDQKEESSNSSDQSKDQNNKQESPEEKEPKPTPGQMTKEEANNLLDSLKGDEKKMPISAYSLEKGEPHDEEIKRDW